MSKQLKSFAEVKAELLEDPEVRAEYEALRPKYELVSQIISARKARGLTQEELAARTGLHRSNISRLESGTYNPSLDLLQKVAHGLDMEVHVEFRPNRG